MTTTQQQQEPKIPVFSVWKNNTILKNIFLINTPPKLSQQENDDNENTNPNNNNNNNNNNNQENKTQDHFEETLLVGRHPDCHIRLEHPSISRFHLRIHSNSSLTRLSITDLASVHGTWVSEMRLEPNVRTTLQETDTLRIGGSSRVYKLHWIPLSQAYDMSNPFVPPLDYPEPRDEEEEEIIEDEESLGVGNDVNVESVLRDSSSLALANDGITDGEMVVPKAPSVQQKENAEAVKKEVTDLEELVLQGLQSLFLEEEFSEVLLQKDILPVPPVPSQSPELFETEDTDAVDSILADLVPLFMGENWEWTCQEDNYLACPTEGYLPLLSEHKDMGSVGSLLEGLGTLFMEDNSECLAETVVPTAPPLPEETVFDGSQTLHDCASDDARESEQLIETIDGKEKPSPLLPDAKCCSWNFWYGSLVAPSSAPSEFTLHEAENCPPEQENDHSGHGIKLGVSPERNFLGNASLCQNSLVKEQKESDLWSFWNGSMGVKSVCSSLPDAEAFSELESSSLGNAYESPQPKSPVLTSFSDSEVFSELENASLRDVYGSPQPISSVKTHAGSPLITSPEKSGCTSSIWSRRGKKDSTPQVVLTNRTEGENTKGCNENAQHERVPRALFHDGNDQDEEEIFTPDKENFTPNTHKSMRKLAVLRELKHSNSGKSPLFKKMADSPNVYYADDLIPASDNKENYCSAKVIRRKGTASRASVNKLQSTRLKERKGERVPFEPLLTDSPQKSASETDPRLKERKGERVPFEPLLTDSPQKSASETCITDDALRSENSVKYAKATGKDKCSREKTQTWNMVVDATTLLDKQSRKALQLLEGLKETQLIIPRIVLRELDYLKRQTSFFRRNSAASDALEWIQDCMIRTPWWIHVQSSVEEGKPVAPTPPASPLSQISCGTKTFGPLSPYESAVELLTPTVEDHVLDVALSYKRTRNDGQLVLVSNDVTLKIKAMAEGIICEEAEEFRESLVNPFSERSLWADSSPRGQTWSYMDDFLLRKKFYPSSMKMTPKDMENVKGLKLVLSQCTIL